MNVGASAGVRTNESLSVADVDGRGSFGMDVA